MTIPVIVLVIATYVVGVASGIIAACSWMKSGEEYFD
jgi:hypothetical protein